MEYSKLERDVRELRDQLNSIECPECGGLHGVHFRLRGDGRLSEPVFERGFFGAPCWGYRRLVIDSLNSLKRRYNIGD